MLLCEASGYDVILVETVGVGQSEYQVASMVDFFLVLMLPNAGDELQGIKRGIMELADALVINKADGDFELAAQKSLSHYRNALHLLQTEGPWTPKVLTCSALNQSGIDQIWEMIKEYQVNTQSTGYFSDKRDQQNQQWLDSLIQEMLLAKLHNNASAKDTLANARAKVTKHLSTPYEAAHEVIKALE